MKARHDYRHVLDIEASLTDMQARSERRAWHVACAAVGVAALSAVALAVMVPFILQEAGVLPRAYVFEGDRMIVLPLMTGLPPVRTQVYLVLASLAAIVAPTLVISRLRVYT